MVQDLIFQTNDILTKKYMVVALGHTKAGKSTLLRELTKMKKCFLPGA
jgi:ABC-type phosphate/phosphonate transport system ATPase subunit